MSLLFPQNSLGVLPSIKNMKVSINGEGSFNLGEFLEDNEFEPEYEEEVLADLQNQGWCLIGGGAAPDFMISLGSPRLLDALKVSVNQGVPVALGEFLLSNGLVENESAIAISLLNDGFWHSGSNSNQGAFGVSLAQPLCQVAMDICLSNLEAN
jgi:hypothetical protein